METVSGVELSEFFSDWLYGEGYPIYEVSWHQNPTNNIVHFTVDQSQSHGSVSFFEMPLPVQVIGTGGESEIIRLEVTSNRQAFDQLVPFDIVSIEIDPDSHLISKNNSSVLKVDLLSLRNNINVYPNPVENILTIKNNSSAIIEKISIYDITGKLIYQNETPTSSVYLHNLKFGIHLMKIETNRGTILKTILKK